MTKEIKEVKEIENEAIYVNCCANHEVNELISGSTIEPSKFRAFVLNENDEVLDEVMPTKISIPKKIIIPEEKEGMIFIVSSLVVGTLEYMNLNRSDIRCPGRSSKDDKGEHGCEGLRAGFHFPGKEGLVDADIQYIKIPDVHSITKEKFLNIVNHNNSFKFTTKQLLDLTFSKVIDDEFLEVILHKKKNKEKKIVIKFEDLRIW